MMPMDISEILEKIDIWDAENVFHLKSDPSRLKKIVAHYELFKKIQNVEGDFLEFGVFKGASFLRFATFSEIFENQNRQFFGFDSFEKFPRDDIKLDSDNEFISRFEEASGDPIGKEKLEELINNKQFTTPENIKLIKGNVFETVPAFLENNQNIKLACIHLDMDVYEPTKYCLDLLFPFLQENGIIICDDYNQVDGATKAFDEFSEKHEKNISKLEFSKTPYFIENN
jgi:hypothetical protein